MPKNLSAQFVCPSPKILDFNEKRLHWVFVVRVISRHWQSESKTVYYKTRMLPNRGLGTIASFIFYSYKYVLISSVQANVTNTKMCHIIGHCDPLVWP